MENNEIKVGMVVRYRADWCSDGERKLLHVVRENRLNPCTDKMSRWLIETINGCTFFHTQEVVEDYMIEPTGIDVSTLVLDH